MSDYPEHEKMMAVKDESQAIGEFLDYGLARQGLRLCVQDGSRFWPANKSIEQILADHFEIDRDKIEEEKRAMLEEQRLLNVQHRRLEGFRKEAENG